MTLHFYDLGWKGINIEPQDHSFRLLKEERTFFDVGRTGGSNFNVSNADRGSALGFKVSSNSNLFSTPERVCEAHARGSIDFVFDHFIPYSQHLAEQAPKRSKLSYFFKTTGWHSSLRSLERRLRHSRRKA